MIVDVTAPPGPALLARAAARFGRAGTPAGFLASETALALVDVEGGEVLGWTYGYVLPRPDGTSMAYLHAIDVADDVRRRGRGGALLDAFLVAARSRGATKAFLILRPASVRIGMFCRFGSDDERRPVVVAASA